MKPIKLLLVASITCALAACAPVTRQKDIAPSAAKSEKEIQHQLALQEQLKRQLRATTVAYPILKSASSYCGEKTGPGIGALITNSGKLPSDWRDAGVHLWQLSDKATIVAIIPGLPAATAGLLPGDVITHINGKELKGGDINEPLKTIARPYTGGSPETFTITRGEAQNTINLQPDVMCDYAIEIAPDDAVNAFADGKKIVITTGMMRFAETNDELSTVIGHELAHNQMGHINSQIGNRVIGALVGALIYAATGVDMTQEGADIGQAAFSKGFESEADYVGLYNAARAGYNITDAPNFWRRMGVEHPKAIDHGSSHPDTANRFLALEQTVREIDQKRESGAELIPETK